MSRSPRRLALTLLLALGACAPAPSPSPDANPSDALDDLRCTDDNSCSDGVFCNGSERCAPTATGANARGCIAAPGPACASGQSCDENNRVCGAGDAGASEAGCDLDGDGVAGPQCGGMDCDDNDADRYPGNVERCGLPLLRNGNSAAAHDEDCNPCTLAGAIPDGDDDGDRFLSARCSNPFLAGVAPVCDAQQTRLDVPAAQVRGSDCNDNPGPLVSADAGASDGAPPDASAPDAASLDASTPDAAPWDGGLSTAMYAAQLVAQSFPLPSAGFLSIRAGESQTVWIELRNVGRTAWDSNTRLGTSQPHDHADPFAGPDWEGSGRPASVAAGVTVAPGSTYRFTFTYSIPASTAAGIYRSHLAVLEEHITWFDPPGQGGPAPTELGALLQVLDASTAMPGAGLTGREVHPSQPELCNGVDDNCSGDVDEGDPGGGGSCGTAVPNVCRQGVNHCVRGALSCTNALFPPGNCCLGFADCDNDLSNGCETDLSNDPLHCGTCGNSCTGSTGGGALCTLGACHQTCPAGQTNCSGSCQDLSGVCDNGMPSYCRQTGSWVCQGAGRTCSLSPAAWSNLTYLGAATDLSHQCGRTDDYIDWYTSTLNGAVRLPCVLQYGPYIALPGGTYVVSITHHQFHSCSDSHSYHMDVNSDHGVISLPPFDHGGADPPSGLPGGNCVSVEDRMSVIIPPGACYQGIEFRFQLNSLTSNDGAEMHIERTTVTRL